MASKLKLTKNHNTMNNKDTSNDSDQSKPKALIFFGGMGLSSYAAKDEFHILGNIEYWDVAASIYRLNHPNTPVLECSSRTLTAKTICRELNIKPGDIDFAQDSFPCTSISSVGPQELFDAGNDQFFVSTKILLDLKVSIILYENVPAICHETMAVLLGMMKALLKKYAPEYTCQAMELNSHLYGDGSARPRFYMMLVHNSIGSPKWPIPVPKSKRKLIRDLYPYAAYIVSRNFGLRQYLPHEPMPTITGHPDLKIYDGEETRDLTPRELAKGMGLPDDYILKGSISDQKLGIGNGMCVEVTRALMKSIREMLETRTDHPAPAPNEPKASKIPAGDKDEKGVIVYQGPSQLDGQEIVAILTLSSNNPKTGDMAQLWILCADIPPLEAIKTKDDSSICGDCSLRHSLGGICYVNIGLAPTTIWKSWKAGLYPEISAANYYQLDNKSIRLGAYGDPQALPIKVLEDLKEWSTNHTSYTHQWRNSSKEMQSISMASVESEEEYLESTGMGWRTFRIIREGDPLLDNEIMCPNITKNVQCKDCNLCSGTSTTAKNIAIPAHGPSKSKYLISSLLPSAIEQTLVDELATSIKVTPTKAQEVVELKSLNPIETKIEWTDSYTKSWVKCKEVPANCKNNYMCKCRLMEQENKNAKKVHETVADEVAPDFKLTGPTETKIEWTDYSWNPWVGCKKVSAGCKNCYMHREMDRWGKDPKKVHKTSSATFRKPLRLTKPSKIFTCSWSDFFIKAADEWRDQAWNIIRQTPQHTYQILTKRPERILECLPKDWGEGYPNVWLGVSVENQQQMKRAEKLVDIPANIRFISAEPLLGKLDLLSPLNRKMLDKIDWVIVGGESGNKQGSYVARPCKEIWIRQIVDDLSNTNTNLFVKQVGTVLAHEMKLKSRHGSKLEELPEWMQMREWPIVSKCD